MADETFDISIRTTADGSGAKEAAEQIKQVTAETEKASAAAEKLEQRQVRIIDNSAPAAPKPYTQPENLHGATGTAVWGRHFRGKSKGAQDLL
jgi:hypothetical protein